jgi:AcrR family transcriptional regulator
MTTTTTSKRRYHSPLRASQAEATRRRVIEAGLELFSTHGIDGTSVGQLARAAGVSPETIYSTFGSKEGVLTAVAVMVARERFPQEAWERGSAERASDPWAQLEFLVDLFGDFYAANADVLGMFGHGGSAVRAAFDEERASRAADPATSFAAMPAGTLRPDLDPVTAAGMLDAILAPEVYIRLVEITGLSVAEYKSRVLDLLVHALLSARKPGRRR